MLGNVAVPDKKGKGLKATATKLYLCFGAQENISVQEGDRNPFFAVVVFCCLFPVIRSLNAPYYERLLLA